MFCRSHSHHSSLRDRHHHRYIDRDELVVGVILFHIQPSCGWDNNNKRVRIRKIVPKIIISDFFLTSGIYASYLRIRKERDEVNSSPYERVNNESGGRQTKKNRDAFVLERAARDREYANGLLFINIKNENLETRKKGKESAKREASYSQNGSKFTPFLVPFLHPLPAPRFSKEGLTQDCKNQGAKKRERDYRS